MSTPLALLVACFNYTKAPEDEFNDWYDLEHIPDRLRLKGFIKAQRWLAADDAKISMATWDLESLDVLKSPQYLAVSGENLSPWSKRIIGMLERIARFEAVQILPGGQVAPDNAGGLLFMAMNVAPEAEAEFNAWYNEEHIPRLSTVPGVLCARRFKAEGGSHKYIATYHLSNPEVQASEAWGKAVASPWQQKMRPLMRDRLRFVLKCYQRKG